VPSPTDLAFARVARLRRELEAYREQDAERARVADRMLELSRLPGAFSREHLEPGHFTASAFVVCPERRRVLLIQHAKRQRWLQPGGHVEAGDQGLISAAEREVAEETGVSGLVPLSDGVFDIDVHAIPARPNEGAHQHFDVRYAFAAPSADLVASDEVRGVRWVEFAAVPALNPEESIVRCVKRLILRCG
jgi:8-oxo-dGTP pyrophosphatase MutT (NUDIX family)